ncbi:MAG: carboxypeptidase-like regulatory domain-containing protein [Draconibacterium sp.]|nr:carboxypeptidase-like regulatory domain-containing protein [Draconibacterium sp.]
MKTLYLLTLILGMNIISVAQQAGKIAQTIKGKVINATTNEPISYTNIGLEGTFFGTASDGEGNFELKIPQELVSKNIFFSAVGFKNKQFPVKSLFDKEFNVVKMEAQSYEIKDIDIAAQNRVLIRILRMASENIPYNFIQGPYNLIGEYNTEKTANNATVKQNAEVLIYDRNGYANPSKKDAFQSLKYSIKKEKWDEDYRFVTGFTNLDELLELDWARSASSVLNPALANGFQLKLDSEPNIDGKYYWVISFKQKQPTFAGSGDFYATSFDGKITINKEDYSILKIEGKVESPKNNRQGRSLAIGRTNKNYFENVSYNFSIYYETLKPAKIELNKSYSSNGEKIQESSTLEITRVKATNLTQLDSRQYFTGK